MLDNAQMPQQPGGGPNDAEFDPASPAPPQVAVQPTRQQVLERLPFRLRSEAQKQYDAHDKSKAELAKLQQDVQTRNLTNAGNAARAVAQNGYKLTDFGLALDHAEALEWITPEQKAALKQEVQDRPDSVKAVTDRIIALSDDATKAAQKDRELATSELREKNAADDRKADNARAEATARETERHNKAMEAYSRVRAANSGAAGAASTEDIKLAVEGMKAGIVPPMLPGRASTAYTAMMAEAVRQKYDLAGAATDWMATQKHIATMNGSQQLRLNQSINALPELLDSVQALADKWDAGRFPLLNAGELKSAEQGLLGKEAAAIARALKTQIADVVADLGNVYMGGNSPTDHALQLAGTALSADWDHDTLTKMVKLAKDNVQIRRNSINNTGVAGASEDNPYAPRPVAPPPPPPVGRDMNPAPVEGATKEIPGYPGTEQTFKGGKWIRTK